MPNDRVDQLARTKPPRPGQPSPAYFTSELYHQKTKRPGFIKRVKLVTGGLHWFSVVPDLTGAWAMGLSRQHADKREAADYVVAWRIMHGFAENGAKK